MKIEAGRFLLSSVMTSMLGIGSAHAGDDRPLWGDTHVHTSYSMDSYMFGNLTADPATAYRYAKGFPVIHPATGARVMLGQPLDFLVVSDHAELIGVPRAIGNNDKRITATSLGRRVYELITSGELLAALKVIASAVGFGGGSSNKQDSALLNNREVIGSNWAEIVDAADHAYEPGQFSSFVGWEWTSNPQGSNLHRVIFTAAAGSKAKSFLPYSSMDSDKPEDLWAWLDRTAARTGAEFVAIPHNSNVSNGLMFNTVDSNGRPINKAYARLRARWEPVVEVTQTKGTSETHGQLSPNDEFATFEFFPWLLNPAKAMRATITPADYVRSALKRGLEFEQKLGINPYKLGMIGSTDTHVGLSSAEESAFHGKTLDDERPSTRGRGIGSGQLPATGWDISASGRAAVWAKENTREAILAAFKRREVYGTTGPRIVLRFFAGFNFAKDAANAKDIAKVGYAGGVPMGSDLARAPKGRALSFLIYAAKDPMDGNLDRVQVVKGWLDKEGKSQEKVYDVAWSGNRKPGPDGKLPSVGNTVDAKTARYTNTIGAAQLATVWTDPDFNAGARAFYYVRVLQIPTPRNTLYDALALGMDVSKTGHPATIQERAYSSPIWYAPS